MSNLKPCPFCGSNDLWSGYMAFGRWEVECMDCGGNMRGGIREETENDWNQRAALAESPEKTNP